MPLPERLPIPDEVDASRLDPDDTKDRLLMAICSIIHLNNNRALCPKEIVRDMVSQGWLDNEGPSAFAQVSMSIRMHLRRSIKSNSPTLLSAYELVGTLLPWQLRAIGLRRDDMQPAIKRGTLWFLNPQLLHCERDPFVAEAKAAGVNIDHPSTVSRPAPTLESLDAFDEEVDFMGRGKRKRKASSMALEAADIDGRMLSTLGFDQSSLPKRRFEGTPQPKITLKLNLMGPKAAVTSTGVRHDALDAQRKTGDAFANRRVSEPAASIPRLSPRSPDSDSDMDVSDDESVPAAAQPLTQIVNSTHQHSRRHTLSMVPMRPFYDLLLDSDFCDYGWKVEQPAGAEVSSLPPLTADQLKHMAGTHDPAARARSKSIYDNDYYYEEEVVDEDDDPFYDVEEHGNGLTEEESEEPDLDISELMTDDELLKIEDELRDNSGNLMKIDGEIMNMDSDLMDIKTGVLQGELSNNSNLLNTNKLLSSAEPDIDDDVKMETEPLVPTPVQGVVAVKVEEQESGVLPITPYKSAAHLRLDRRRDCLAVERCEFSSSCGDTGRLNNTEHDYFEYRSDLNALPSNTDYVGGTDMKSMTSHDASFNMDVELANLLSLMDNRTSVVHDTNCLITGMSHSFITEQCTHRTPTSRSYARMPTAPLATHSPSRVGSRMSITESTRAISNNLASPLVAELEESYRQNENKNNCAGTGDFSFVVDDAPPSLFDYELAPSAPLSPSLSVFSPHASSSPLTPVTQLSSPAPSDAVSYATAPSPDYGCDIMDVVITDNSEVDDGNFHSGPKQVDLEELDQAWLNSKHSGDQQSTMASIKGAQLRCEPLSCDSKNSSAVVVQEDALSSPHSSNKQVSFDLPDPFADYMASVRHSLAQEELVTHGNRTPVVAIEREDTPALYWTLLERGIALYALAIQQHHTFTALLRRMDTNYVNGTCLFNLISCIVGGTLDILDDASVTVSVTDSDVQGDWIPLEVAQRVVQEHLPRGSGPHKTHKKRTANSNTLIEHLHAFLAKDLDTYFPEPIANMQSVLSTLPSKEFADSDSVAHLRKTCTALAFDSIESAATKALAEGARRERKKAVSVNDCALNARGSRRSTRSSVSGSKPPTMYDAACSLKKTYLGSASAVPLRRSLRPSKK